MQQFALFTFYGNLNDFLSKKDRNKKITYSFRATPSVKDAVEAIGVPHVEVEWLQVNATPALFSYYLQAGDEVEVYPQDSPAVPRSAPPLRDNSQRPHSFVLDMHLGALARRLRLLGIDTLYHKHITDKELAHLSSEEHRVALTRDIALLKQKIIDWGYWLRSQQPEEQLLEVVKRYALTPFFAPFSRCLSCNGLIHPVKKETVLESLPHGTKEYFDNFYQCRDCGKVYWKGSHYERMIRFIEELKAKL
jgi:uncharacterized protein with PIN domain